MTLSLQRIAQFKNSMSIVKTLNCQTLSIVICQVSKGMSIDNKPHSGHQSTVQIDENVEKI